MIVLTMTCVGDVLILILVEVGFGETVLFIYQSFSIMVLILILVEVGFGEIEFQGAKCYVTAGLNPYSSGGGVRCRS